MARDPKRIPEILKVLQQYWEKHYDLRLGQIVSNISREVLDNYDPFYMEDDDLIKTLKNMNQENQENQGGQ